MAVFGITMVRNEADIIEHTLRQMMTQVDHVIVADNGSDDGTREILEGFDVTIVDDPDPAYYQSRKMSALAQRAAQMGAEWVAAFDADEFWYSPFGRIGDILSAHDGAVATVAIFDHRATGEDSDDPNPIARMGWRLTEALPLHKIACRPILRATVTQGNHSAHYPSLAPLEGQIVIRHFPIRSIEQMIRKARQGGKAYEATDLPEDTGGHWRGWNRLTDEQIADVFRAYYWHADPHADGLIFDPILG